MPRKVTNSAPQEIPPELLALLRGPRIESRIVNPIAAADLAAERIFAAAQTARASAENALNA